MLTELQPRRSLNVCRIWFHPYTERNADSLRTGLFRFKADILFSLVQIELQSLLEEITNGLTVSLHAPVWCYLNVLDYVCLGCFADLHKKPTLKLWNEISYFKSRHRRWTVLILEGFVVLCMVLYRIKSWPVLFVFGFLLDTKMFKLKRFTCIYYCF